MEERPWGLWVVREVVGDSGVGIKVLKPPFNPSMLSRLNPVVGESALGQLLRVSSFRSLATLRYVADSSLDEECDVNPSSSFGRELKGRLGKGESGVEGLSNSSVPPPSVTKSSNYRDSHINGVNNSDPNIAPQAAWRYLINVINC